MTLEEFAKLSGVKLIDCEKGWGGGIGYTTADSPNCSVCGFRTERAALNSWMKDTFGEQAAKALKLLFAGSERRAG